MLNKPSLKLFYWKSLCSRLHQSVRERQYNDIFDKERFVDHCRVIQQDYYFTLEVWNSTYCVVREAQFNRNEILKATRPSFAFILPPLYVKHKERKRGYFARLDVSIFAATGPKFWRKGVTPVTCKDRILWGTCYPHKSVIITPFSVIHVLFVSPECEIQCFFLSVL